MRAIMLMFDSLNRRMLSNYGADWVHTPNFKRLAEKTVTFDNFYVGSLPCIPARRELHTGRYNFLHRSWGPMEAFDDSMPEILKKNGIYTRLISDHGHYWEDGGATYHSRYSSWDCIRGQEADPWSDAVNDPEIPDHVKTMREFTHHDWWVDSFKNKEIIHDIGKWPQDAVFESGLRFLNKNKDADNWFVQIETFDPHEPFDVPDKFRSLYDDPYDGKHFDWPPYAPVSELPEQVAHIRKQYAALVSMCDKNIGRIIDFMDEHDMWKDTMLIVNTDHGYFLGEKEWWAKSVMPCYNEVAHIPFFIWNPKLGVKNVRRKALAQTIDIPATVLDFFGTAIPKDMEGMALNPVIENDTSIRDCALFGYHGSFVNITDGKHTYMRSSESVSNEPLSEYTLATTRMRGFFRNDELAKAEMVEPMRFTKGCRIMRVPNASRLKNATYCNSFQYGHLLWDLEQDPEQLNKVDDPELEARLLNQMIEMMKANDAPREQYQRLGIDPDCVYDVPRILDDRRKVPRFEDFTFTSDYEWSEDTQNIFIGMLSLMPSDGAEEYFTAFGKVMEQSHAKQVKREHFVALAKLFYSKNEGEIFYFINKLSRIR